MRIFPMTALSCVPTAGTAFRDALGANILTWKKT